MSGYASWREDHFSQFARNGRWGTCVDCPRDSHGLAYPEFCRHTDRYDHHSTADGLFEQWRLIRKFEEAT